MSVLQAVSLAKSFGHRLVVKGVSLEVRSGEIIGLLGRNGAGKTTTFRMMVGLLKPDSGQILLDEKDISLRTTPERAREGIIYLPQENSVFLRASVENNLKLILELQPCAREKQERKAEEVLGELGLLELRNQPAHSLSGGERRKLEICRSLILNPKFLLLDEPFTGIDPLTILDLQKIFLSLRDGGIGIIISDHNVRDTFKVTDRAYIVDEGVVLIEGSAEKIATDEAAKEKFLGKGFVLGGEILNPPQKKSGLPESRPRKT